MIPTKVILSIACCVAILSSSCNPNEQVVLQPPINIDSLLRVAYHDGEVKEFNRWKNWQQDRLHEVLIITTSAAVNNKRNCCDLAKHILNEYNKALQVYYNIPQKP